MVARFSDRQVEDAGAIAAANDAVRDEALGWADADGAAYGRVLEAMRTEHPSQDLRRAAVAAALEAACDVPIAIIGRAVRVGVTAHELARIGNPNLRGDALTGLHLATAAARSSLELVRENTQLGGLDGARLDLLRRDVGELGSLAAPRPTVDDRVVDR